MTYKILAVVGISNLHKMESNNCNSCYAPHAVKNFKMLFGFKDGGA